MSSGDFEAELRQSVADNLALIANAAKAAKARIGQSVAGITPPEPVRDDGPRPAVNFDAAEPVFADEPMFGEEPAFADEPAYADEGHPAEFETQPSHSNGLPEGAITFDNFDSGMDDEGIPVWEDPP